MATSSLGVGSGTVGSGTQGQFAFYNANGATLTATSSLFLSPSGYLGIGTTSPAYALDVNGTINAGDVVSKGPAIDVRAYPSLNAAISDIGSSNKTLVISNQQSVTSNVTVPSNVTLEFLQGGSLAIANGVTVSVINPIVAGTHQIFYLTGTGAVSLGAMTISPEWWGAAGNGVTDDGAVLQAMWNSISDGSTVTFTSGKTYYITQGSTISHSNINITGYGATLKWNGALSRSLLIGGFASNADMAMVFWDGVGKTYNLNSQGVPSTPTQGTTLKNIRIYGLTFDAGGGLLANTGNNWLNRSQAIFLGSVDGFEIKDTTFQNMYGEAILGAWYDNNGRITNNRFINCGHDGIAPITLTNSIISNNLFQDVYQGMEFGPYNVLIEGNTFLVTQSNSGVSKGIWLGDSSLGLATDVTIVGNTFGQTAGVTYAYNVSTGVGIYVNAYHSAADIKRVQITDNKFDIAVAGGHADIIVDANPGNTTIKNNTFTDTGLSQAIKGYITYKPSINSSIDQGVVDISDNTFTVENTNFQVQEGAIYIDNLFSGTSMGKTYGVVSNNKLYSPRARPFYTSRIFPRFDPFVQGLSHSALSIQH